MVTRSTCRLHSRCSGTSSSSRRRSIPARSRARKNLAAARDWLSDLEEPESCMMVPCIRQQVPFGHQVAHSNSVQKLPYLFASIQGYGVFEREAKQHFKIRKADGVTAPWIITHVSNRGQHSALFRSCAFRKFLFGRFPVRVSWSYAMENSQRNLPHLLECLPAYSIRPFCTDHDT
jgi:hypothetical protein